eukprot:TRINITY_DN22105_c0_g1_i1.p1 TRINITY_DN22105_c0_g1~~TRINITY_DN22105_c0_g1_i1.p1  ORF type:complete len:324 (+),score=63.97 TRINITY_DN22105_c0_g1_i1:60-974(+)
MTSKTSVKDLRTIGADLPQNAVFVGATSGIGQHMAQQLAKIATRSTKIMIVGRNESAAQEIIKNMQSNPHVQGSFLACDVTTMANIKTLAKQIERQFDSLNLLVMSPGYLSMDGRTETEDGVDRKIAAHYYSRFTLTYLLIPLLERAISLNQDARVMSVLAAGHGGHIYLDDLALKDNFGLKAAADVATTYNDLMVESFSQRHPKIGFFHIAPGIVSTPLAKNLPWYARWATNGLYAVIGKSSDDCATLMLQGLLDPNRKTGWYLLDQYGNQIQKSQYHTNEARDIVWKHSIEVAKLEEADPSS